MGMKKKKTKYTQKLHHLLQQSSKRETENRMKKKRKRLPLFWQLLTYSNKRASEMPVLHSLGK